jgi:hypothetical protein
MCKEQYNSLCITTHYFNNELPVITDVSWRLLKEEREGVTKSWLVSAVPYDIQGLHSSVHQDKFSTAHGLLPRGLYSSKPGSVTSGILPT